MFKNLKFQSCLNCGSIFINSSLFCSPCVELLISSFKSKSLKQIHRFPVQPLLIWPPGKSDSLSQLILSLKDSPINAWEFYAKNFYANNNDSLNTKELVFISHKSHSGKLHAWNWAESLSRIFGGQHIEALELVKNTAAQKTLSVSQRENRVMRPLVEISSLTDQNIVFVDDVVTTGFTALAAYKALNQPKNYQVWCLAWRPASSIAAR